MPAPFVPHDPVCALKKAEWSLGLTGSAITTLTDAQFVGQIGRGLRSLYQDVCDGWFGADRAGLGRRLADGESHLRPRQPGRANR